MAEHVRGTTGDALTISSNSINEPLSPQFLAHLRALVINPSTPDTTISSIFETLTRSLQLSRNPLLLHHNLKLLSDLAARHSRLSRPVFDLVRSHSLLSASSTRLAAESLDVLASIVERDRDLVSTVDELDGGLFASLCFSPSVSVRAWLLGNAERFLVSSYLLFTMFLGFTKDPYPCVRRVALDGLVRLSKFGVIDDGEMVSGCYYRAVELLGDMEDYVRRAAVRAVCAWGLVLAASNPETKLYYSDEVFVKLCSMARDMSMEVRVEAFNALGNIEMVSEDILLQTLSKRVLGIAKANKPLGQRVGEQFGALALNAAGALVHGLEDEFFEFLGPLVDRNSTVRAAVRNILKLVKLPDFGRFKLTVDALVENLETYMQDEADVFSVLFHLGQSHGKFVACIIEKISQQIEPNSDGKLGFDGTRVAAFLVLAISVPPTNKHRRKIPPTVFSYAVTLLGRISRALRDVMSQSVLLAYLSQSSRSTTLSAIQEVPCLPLAEGVAPQYTNDEIVGSVAMPLQQEIDRTSQIQLLAMKEPREAKTSSYQQDGHDEVIKSVEAIFAKVKEMWILVQSGHIYEVMRTLRTCKEELETFNSDSCASAGVLAFTLQYVQTIKVLAKVWEHFRPSKFLPRRIGTLEILFGKLEKRLRELRGRFIGLSKDEELHILELFLVTYTLRLSRVEICCKLATLRKLRSTISNVEALLKEGSAEPSKFITEVGNLSSEICASFDDSSCTLSFHKLMECFSLQKLFVRGSLKHVKAELHIPDNNSENPLHFVSGLPVGIPCQIILHNILVESRLWLRMRSDNESTQFIFLDVNLFEGCDDYRRFTFVSSFYRTPKARSFGLRICIGMECSFEDSHFAKGHWGPKHELTYLCEEKEVYLSLFCKC
ncbi:hypothetical protein UlMin_000897 [Ulmus minor]